MKSSPKESAMTSRLLKELKERDILAWKNHGSLYSKAGIPDVSVILRGVTLYIEMKRPGETSTPIQKAMQAKLREAGAPVYEAHGWEEALNWILSSNLSATVNGFEFTAFVEEEAAVEEAQANVDPRVPAELACPNCGARSTDLIGGWECPSCSYRLSREIAEGRVDLRLIHVKLDRMARGPVGALVKKFATKKKGPE